MGNLHARLTPLLGLLAALLAWAAPAHADEPDVGPPITACADVRFIGAAGSGQFEEHGGFGREMSALRTWIELRLPGWVDFAATPVNYPAHGVDQIITQPDLYFGGVAFGEHETLALLDRIQEHCPDERVILGGFSSGAMVIHNVLDHIAFQPHWAGGHLIGSHLLADPRRVGSDTAVNRGGAAANLNGITDWGQYFADTEGASSIPLPVVETTRSYCGSGDPVCAFRIGVLNLAGVGRHTSYGTEFRLPQVFSDEAKRLARPLVEQFPPISQRYPAVDERLYPGEPVNYDLLAGFDDAAVTFASDDVPAPLTLTARGALKGAAPAIGFYRFNVRATTKRGGTSRFEVFLEVRDPFYDVEPDRAPLVVPWMPVHQPVSALLPTVPAKSVVSLSPGAVLPPGLRLSTAGRLTGTPVSVGTWLVDVRIAPLGGPLRRVLAELNVTNPGKLATATASGAPSTGELGDAVLLGPDRVAFVSTAGDLGAENPDGLPTLYVSDVDTGAVAHWQPPAGESICAITADDTKSTLYVATEAWREFVNENGDPDGEPVLTIRRVGLSGAASGSELATHVDAKWSEDCGGEARFAASSALGLVVVARRELDAPGQPAFGTAVPGQLYLARNEQYEPVDWPLGNPSWGVTSIEDVASAASGAEAPGALLVTASRPAVGTINFPGQLETRVFALDPAQAWQQVDGDRRGVKVPMVRPRFYAGGTVFAVTKDYASSLSAKPRRQRARRSAVIADEYVLRSKKLTNAASKAFGPAGADRFTPLDPERYGAGCGVRDRTRSAWSSRADVTVGDQIVAACFVRPPRWAASSFAAGAGGSMLVAGQLDGHDQLIIARVP